MAGPVFLCAHCNEKMLIRTSKQTCSLYKEVYFQCSNIFCGWTAHGEFTITHQISPSAIPNDSINLPTFDPKIRKTA